MQVVNTEVRPEAAPRKLARLSLDRVRQLPLFANLPLDTVAQILERAENYAVERDDFLYQRGEPAEYFFILSSGRLILSFPGHKSRDTIIDIVNPYQCFAENAIFPGETYILDARALETSEVVAIPAKEFRRKLDHDYRLVEGLIASLCVRMRGMIDQLGELKGKTTAQRVGGFMLQLSDAKNGAVVVRLPYEKRLLAGRLGMKPESLSRALFKLRQLGVRGREDVFAIDDIERLRDFCQGADGDE
jgi:CRP-like cAMP-binding protein